MDTGWIVAIVLGAVLVVTIIIFLVWYFTRGKKTSEDVMDDVETEGRAKDYESGSANDKWEKLLKEIERDKIRQRESANLER
jgi:uncharacterized membrane protein